MALATGTRIGAYEIVGAIGAGGMGEVYRARDTRLNRDVALKVLPPSLADDPDRLARFRREAQVLASLNHPNIATVHGFEEAGNVRALVMELVEGQTLWEMLSGSALPLSEALPIARQIAEALEVAHEQGIVHRDLKPANVKVRTDGTVKVLDFGLAKALGVGPDDAGSSGSEAMNSPTLTAAAFAAGYGAPGTMHGVILGTAAYMSPEQAKGKPVDRRADIWAFGVVFYEMLSGRRGYHAEDISETLAAVLTREVDWSALPADIPPRLRALLGDCLVRDPKQRLRDIGEARRVIDQVITGAPASTITGVPASSIASTPAIYSPARSRFQRALPWTVAAIALAVAGGLLWQRFRAPEPPTGLVTRSRIVLKDLSGFVNVSRDGTKVVYTVTGGTQGLFLALRQMDQFEAKPIPGSDGAIFPIFSPDGLWVAYSMPADSKIKKIPITGGASIQLTDGFLSDGADWGDDDTIVFSSPQGLKRVSAAGGAAEQLTKLDVAKGEQVHRRPQFLPDGKHVLFTIRSASSETQQFAVVDLAGGAYRTIAPGGDNGRYVSSGHLTYGRQGTVFAVPFDLDRLAVAGPEVPVIESVSATGPPGTCDYTVSGNGLLVYSEGLAAQGSTLMWADRKGTLETIPGQVMRRWGTGRLSPDGLRLANGIHAEKGTDIWVMDLAKGTPTRLTFGGENDRPVWAPDGRSVVYGADAGGKFGLYSVATDGSGAPVQVLATERYSYPLSFSHGKTLLFRHSEPGGRAQIFVVDLGTGNPPGAPRLLREGTAPDLDAQFSPDGKWVAFTSAETGSPEVYVMAFPGPGGRTRVSTSGGRDPRWAKNGRELLFWGSAPGSAPMFSAAVQTSPSLAVSVPTELFRMTAGTTWDPVPNHDRLLVENSRSPGVATVFATVTDWFEELRQRAPVRK